jgi:hypothetical protein
MWGFDDPLRSFFAELWPNGSRRKEPVFFLPNPDEWYVYWWPPVLAVDLVEVTEMSPVAVCTALQLLDPRARLRPADELEARLDSPPGVSEEYHDGFRRAVLWVLGEEDTCPGSGQSWSGGLPSPQLVGAECELLSGHCYSQKRDEVLDQQFAAGGHVALYWALGDALPGED